MSFPSPSRFSFCLPILLLSIILSSPWARADKLLVKNGLILTMKPGEKDPFTGYLLVGDDGKIKAIGKGAPPANLSAVPTYDAEGKFISPGFISAHSHIWQSVNRGLGADFTLFNWIGAFSPYTEQSTPEDQYWYTKHGCMDFLKYGITSAYNFTYSWWHWAGYEHASQAQEVPYRDYQETQFKGELESGLRFIHSFSLPDVKTELERRPIVEKFIAFTKHYRDNPHFLGLAISGGVAFSAHKETAFTEAAYMRDYHLDNQLHYLEPPDGLNQRDKFAWLKESGMLGPQLYFGHFIHTTPEIVAEAAKAGSNMVWNPMSNGRLGSGFADIPAYLKAGMKVGMGVDDQAASDVPDPFENMRTGLYYMRAKYENAAIMSAYDVLSLHTLGSATVMHVADRVGSLEVGKYADFLVINPRDRDIGPVYDPYATLVLACSQANLERVYSGGDMVSERGVLHVKGQDFELVSQEAHRRAEAIRDRVKAQQATPSAPQK